MLKRDMLGQVPTPRDLVRQLPSVRRLPRSVNNALKAATKVSGHGEYMTPREQSKFFRFAPLPPIIHKPLVPAEGTASAPHGPAVRVRTTRPE